MGRMALLVMMLAAGTARADKASLQALLARTDAVAKEVAKARGLKLRRAIPNDVVDKAELRTRVLAQIGEDKSAAQLVSEGRALERWGLIPPGTDLQALYVELLTEQIAGYYDPKTKKLTIAESAGDNAAWSEMVLAHELDHGLQDQAFDLHAFLDLPDTEGDAAAARHALVEGDGVGLMIEVVLGRTHSTVDWANPEVASAIGKAMGTPGSGSATFDKAPLAIREEMLFPYRAGFAFVAALRRHQPWRAVDAAFARPPRSTEQILHPELYIADEKPVPIRAAVPPALADYAIANSTVWGELGFTLWLRSHGVDEAIANEAAAGWGGDRAILLARADSTVGLSRPGISVGLSRSEWDTEADAIEATEAATKAMDASIVGATVERAATATRWLALDGTVSWVERRGPSLVIAIGAPASVATALAAQAWTATGIAPPPKKRSRK